MAGMKQTSMDRLSGIATVYLRTLIHYKPGGHKARSVESDHVFTLQQRVALTIMPSPVKLYQ